MLRLFTVDTADKGVHFATDTAARKS